MSRMLWTPATSSQERPQQGRSQKLLADAGPGAERGPKTKPLVTLFCLPSMGFVFPSDQDKKLINVNKKKLIQ
jgi:hypothetical protein